jgi:hypothetical protein
MVSISAAAEATTHKHKQPASTVKSSSSSSKKSSHSSHSTHTASAHSTSTHSTHGKHGKSVKTAKKSWKSKGQHGITSDRTREIQEALIRQHYLDGEANGIWDTRTQEACRKFQADNGWQSKVLPDSRALIKLGLGPDHKDVLNPETAATSPFLPGGGVKAEGNPIAPATASVPEQ